MDIADCPWSPIGGWAALGFGALGAVLVACVREGEVRKKPKIERRPGSDRIIHALTTIVAGAGLTWGFSLELPCLTPLLAISVGIVATILVKAMLGWYQVVKAPQIEEPSQVS